MFPPGDSEIPNEDRARTAMQRFRAAYARASHEVFDEFGAEKSQEFVTELQFKITSQLFGHHPLSRGYYLWKLRRRIDPRVLMATGEYLNGMISERVTTETGEVTYRAGMAHARHSSGMWLSELQRFLEEGTSRVPARPHWRPQIRVYRARSTEMGRDLRNRIARRTASYL